MSHPILFVCQSCRLSDRDEGNLADGAQLLKQLQDLNQGAQPFKLEIQPVPCLWICRQGCAATLRCSHKCTYLFTHLLGLESAMALLQFSELYFSSQDGQIPWKQIPGILKNGTIARMPFAGQVITDED